MHDTKMSLLAEAIAHHMSFTAIYKSEIREFSPHVIGKGRYGEDVVLVYQYGGMSGGRPTNHVPPERCWRMFVIADLHGLKAVEGVWHSHKSYGAALARLRGVSAAVPVAVQEESLAMDRSN